MPTPDRSQAIRLFAEALQTQGRRSVSAANADASGVLALPITIRLLDDLLTPVAAYRRLVEPDDRDAPSFLFESVEQGRQSRYSILGAAPVLDIIAHEQHAQANPREGIPPFLLDRIASVNDSDTCPDPLSAARELSRGVRTIGRETPGRPALPSAFLGGWVGYAAFDSVRYAEPNALGFDRAPKDDRHLPDVCLSFYDGSAVFDHADKTVHVVQYVFVPEHQASDPEVVANAYDIALARLESRAELLSHERRVPLKPGRLSGSPADRPAPMRSNTDRPQHRAMVERAQEYIRAGDIFQVVIGQRFEKPSDADPFDVYRALRAVNPSPYMVYLQASGCILVASSPEILCRVRREPSSTDRADARTNNVTPFVVTNRPLAGTRRRGQTHDEDQQLEAELLSDPKERAEHVMLVDLGRNDVGVVSTPGTVKLERVMDVERYSHVMHLSSTVTGQLRPELDAWDALRAALPVGTISGAPKIRALQIIDELESVRRGPYGGGIGYITLDGEMDIALALRTIVAPTNTKPAHNETADSAQTGAGVVERSGVAGGMGGAGGRVGRGGWVYHVQAAGGIVLDSDPDAEFEETVNKSAALARAIDLAERMFTDTDNDRTADTDQPPTNPATRGA